MKNKKIVVIGLIIMLMGMQCRGAAGCLVLEPVQNENCGTIIPTHELNMQEVEKIKEQVVELVARYMALQKSSAIAEAELLDTKSALLIARNEQLIQAIKLGEIVKVKALIDSKADVNTVDLATGFPVVTLADEYKNTEIVEQLLAAGATGRIEIVYPLLSGFPGQE